MLVKNPITSFLYFYGYDGIEDIYDFWNNNKTDIIESYKIEIIDKNFEYNLREFEHKIIWSSVCGIFLRFEISMYFDFTHDRETDLSNIKTHYDGNLVSIYDFHKIDKDDYIKSEKTDLKGASLLELKISNMTVKNIDFEYGALNNSTFKNVIFKNCSFKNADLSNSKLLDCIFEEDCVFINTKFNNSVINSEFKCKLNNIEINYMNLLILSKKRIKYYLKYPEFTIILNKSFVYKSNNTLIKDQYEKQSAFRNIK